MFLDYASLANLRQLGHQGTEPVEPLLAPLSSAASAHGWTFLEEGCSLDLDSPEEAGNSDWLVCGFEDLEDVPWEV